MTNTGKSPNELPLPGHFNPDHADSIWRVPYGERAREAAAWTGRHGIRPAHEDRFRIGLVLVDMQNTFCLPDGELFAAGRSGRGAVDDTVRLCRFIYHNLHRITRISPTLDTHLPMQIFHAVFLIDDHGHHPEPYTDVTREEVDNGRWRFNPALAETLGVTAEEGQRRLEHYVRTLESTGKFALTIWPYHALLGGVSHALTSLIEEAVFYHALCRGAVPDFQVKGDYPWTEHYSVLGPEVLEDPDGQPMSRKNTAFLDALDAFDAVVLTGQAKSHCLAWSVQDILEQKPEIAPKVYLLEDCTSPVVIPDGPDFTETAAAAFERFREAGMHIVQSSRPMAEWPGLTDHVRDASRARTNP